MFINIVQIYFNIIYFYVNFIHLKHILIKKFLKNMTNYHNRCLSGGMLKDSPY